MTRKPFEELCPRMQPRGRSNSQVSTCFQSDAGRATRVAEIRPASHTLLSTYFFIPEEPLLGKEGFTYLSRGVCHRLAASPD